MIDVLKNYFISANPFVFISGCLPLLAGFILWLSFYIKYDRNILRKLEWSFLRISNCAEGFTKCRSENLKTMNEVALDLATPQFEAAWKKMMQQAELRYTEEILPEGECYFRKDVLITVPASRSSMTSILSMVWVLLFLSVLLPPLCASIVGFSKPELYFIYGLFPAVLLLLIQLTFTAMDRRAMNRTMAAYHRFLYAFDTAVPTAAEMAGPALLLDATRKNQKSFEKMSADMAESFSMNTNKISIAIDEFANGGVLPAIQETMKTLTSEFLVPAAGEIRDKLDETLKAVTERQESGMRELAVEFAAKLSDTLEYRIKLLADALGQYQNRMEEQNNSYQARIDELNYILTSNMREMSAFMDQQSRSMERSEQILQQASELFRVETKNTEQLNLGLENMLQLTELTREQHEKFAKDLFAFIENQQEFSKLVKDVTGMMQVAMEGAGREIAKGINQAVGDNAQAIADLTVQAQALRDDYEVFFARSEEVSQKTLDEMDYQIQGMITRMSEEIGAILKTAVEKNGEVLNQYKDQTADILASFDEQARSISLYAKEINMDISELSSSLGVSVTDFNEKMRDGIQLAISDFDKGLAELTERIANTVESITDAVETLPDRIKMINLGR